MSSNLKLLIKFPTRGRPSKFFRVLDLYYQNLTGTNYEFVISCDHDDEHMNNDVVRQHFTRYPNLTVCYGNNNSKIEAVNADVGDREFDILLQASDDMIPEIMGYDQIICNQMERCYPDTDGILWFFDGWRKDLNTLCILGKKYYDRFGYIYYPEYKSFWCDSEFTDIGNILERQTFISQVIIRHLHPDIVMQSTDASKKFHDLYPEVPEDHHGHDTTWKKNSIPGDPDHDLYKRRKQQGFGLKK